ncbi:undecaprenyl-diphosphate phosphatase [Ruminococcus sp. Marseille-P6503]|uniref:undecaprenyl-diphosphate phosphatase n=1 Tax=Ruminococcus sp. Marseille-P6503 TaxID=2364796 RepID=UPI000F53F92D|nr:undecaprenyl-diphosphate phosphatase [Ruminococcus sp. Marseille-P6503]
MGMINAVFQAIIQGLTEFLPVSSSGHLSLFQHFTGKSGEGALMYSAVLHLGTLVAVFFAFKKTIIALIKEFFVMLRDIFTGKFKWREMNPERRMIVMIVISTACLIPFYLFKDWFTGIAEDKSIFAEGLCFLYTAGLLFMSDKCVKGKKTPKNITAGNAVTVGFFQGVALLPGVSRSGSTISAGLFSGFSRETAVQYSFILGIPAILGGCAVEIKDAVGEKAAASVPECIIGFIVAAIVGVCAIKLVNWLVKTDKFKIFGYYTFILGIIVIVVSIIEKFVGHALVIG